jgi:hypothetical protein
MTSLQNSASFSESSRSNFRLPLISSTLKPSSTLTFPVNLDSLRALTIPVNLDSRVGFMARFLGIRRVPVKHFYNTYIQCYTLVQQSCTLVLQIKSFGGAPSSLAVHRVAPPHASFQRSLAFALLAVASHSERSIACCKISSTTRLIVVPRFLANALRDFPSGSLILTPSQNLRSSLGRPGPRLGLGGCFVIQPQALAKPINSFNIFRVFVEQNGVFSSLISVLSIK